MLVLRTSNLKGATIKPIVPRHKHSIVAFVYQGRVDRKPVNANPGLKVNLCSHFSSCKNVFDYLCFVYSLRLFNPNLKDKQYKQKTSPKNYQTHIKILANPGLA